jgi:hypothetical protein
MLDSAETETGNCVKPEFIVNYVTPLSHCTSKIFLCTRKIFLCTSKIILCTSNMILCTSKIFLCMSKIFRLVISTRQPQPREFYTDIILCKRINVYLPASGYLEGGDFFTRPWQCEPHYSSSSKSCNKTATYGISPRPDNEKDNSKSFKRLLRSRSPQTRTQWQEVLENVLLPPCPADDVTIGTQPEALSGALT